MLKINQHFEGIILFITPCILLLMTSCQKDEIKPFEKESPVSIRSQKIIPTDVANRKIVLGNEINSPLEISNLNQAAQTVSSSKVYTATHQTVKFTPQDIEEYQAILMNTNFIAVNFPLDHEIDSMGTYFYNRSDLTQLTPLWAQVEVSKDLSAYSHTVKKEFNFNTVDTTILKQAFQDVGIDTSKVYAYVYPYDHDGGGGLAV